MRLYAQEMKLHADDSLYQSALKSMAVPNTPEFVASTLTTPCFTSPVTSGTEVYTLTACVAKVTVAPCATDCVEEPYGAGDYREPRP